MKRMLAAVLALALWGCGGQGPPVPSLYEVPASVQELSDEHFLDHPFPSDLRVQDGAVVFEGFYNPRGIPLIEEYIGATKGILDGFSPVAAGYLRFTAALDPATLPASPLDALSPEASVQLIDVDPDSPEFGQRKLINTSFRAPGGHYVLSNTLRWMPVPGYPLRPKTRYALVTTDALRSSEDGLVLASDALSQVLGLAAANPQTQALADAWGPDIDTVEQLGVARTSITHLAVFTTSDPIGELTAFSDHLRANVPPPTFHPRQNWQSFQRSGFVEYINSYGPSPNYQAGVLPFETFGDGGQLNYDADGQPAVVDTFDLRFSLSVPSNSGCPMPAAGYPIVLYAHGTGGAYRSYVNSGIAKMLAINCIASMGVDQIFHGTRPGAPSDTTAVQLLFFNFQNVHAARSNGRQSALDEVQRARLFTESRAHIPAEVSHNGERIYFDPSKVMFFGHSQGGLNGPLYLALDDSARGGVLSGSGGVFSITLLEKTKPTPSVATVVRTIFLALTTEEYEELDIFHPAVSLAQSLVDVIDPINYVHLVARSPRPGFAPKSVLMTEGIAPDGTGDNLTPPLGTEAQAVAMGLPLQNPAQRLYPQLSYGAEGPVDIPPEGLSGNLAGGAASGALAQWAPPEGGEGHYVVFDINEARNQAVAFLVRLAADPVGNVPAPY